MGNKKCPYCFTEMDSRASVCPSCRKKVGSANSKGVARKHFSVGSLLGVMLMLFILMGIFGTIVGNVKDAKNQRPDEDRMKVAYQASQDFVSRHLKAPSSADFPYYQTSFVKKIKDDPKGRPIYRIDAFVDAQNSFGAKIRTNYTCEVLYDSRDEGKEWKLISVKLD